MLPVLLLLAGAGAAAASADHCSFNLVPSNTTYMQFTKELITHEYGFQGQFKSIHCCVKGYRSIEWFKDRVPYPWAAGRSNLILYPKAGNQTLYVPRAALSDSGRYKCRASNHSAILEHVIDLEIFGKVTDAPRVMFVSQDQIIEEGNPLRLFCEALIEKAHLADAASDLKWKRVLPNESEVALLPSQREMNTTREDVPTIVGSYLFVDNMSAEDYGRFVCVVRSNNVPVRYYVNVNPPIPLEECWKVNSVPWRGLLMSGTLFLCLALVVAAANRPVPARWWLLLRRARALAATPGQRARVMEKEFDVLVSWTPVDRELVRGALLPTLKYKYKYRVHGLQVPTEPDDWYNEMVIECRRCRVLVAVLSPSQYTPLQLLLALRQLRALPVPSVVALLQDLPDLTRKAKESGETLINILRHTRLIPWRSLHDRDFWTKLRLALPMPPPYSSPIPPPIALNQTLVEPDGTTNPRLTALVA